MTCSLGMMCGKPSCPECAADPRYPCTLELSPAYRRIYPTAWWSLMDIEQACERAVRIKATAYVARFRFLSWDEAFEQARREVYGYA